MTQLKIFEVPATVLSEKALPVEQVTDEIRQTLADMLETMYASGGVGLAGNQVGLLKRLVVVDCAGEGEKPAPLKMINPEIIATSESRVCRSEGCLSVPREYADVTRFEEVVVRYLDENGQEKTHRAQGLLAIACQHEIDHLNGVLFLDHLSPLKRGRLLKHLEKRRRKQAREATEREE